MGVPLREKTDPRPVPLRPIEVRERLLAAMVHLVRVAVASSFPAEVPGVVPAAMGRLLRPPDVLLPVPPDRGHLPPYLFGVVILRTPFCVSALDGAVRAVLRVLRPLHLLPRIGTGGARVPLPREVGLPRRLFRLLVVPRY